jgi:hypothetical protein
MRKVTLSSDLSFCLYVVVACSVLFVGAEAGLRWAFPDRILSTPDYETIETDQTLGYRLKPSITASFQRSRANGGDRIQWRTNSQGYRGDELRMDGTPRVVIYGDSNVQAVFSADENTFPQRLERGVSETLGRSIEMINGGVIGYGPDHYLLRMTADLPDLQPSLVVLAVFADNDLGDLLRHRLFELRDGQLVRRTNHFVYRPPPLLDRARLFARTLLITRATTRMLSAFDASGADGSAVSPDPSAAETQIRLLEQLTAEAFDHYSKPDSQLVRGDYYDLDVAIAPERDSSRAKLGLFRSIMVEAKRVADRAGVPLLVVIQPSRIDLTTAGIVNFESLSRAYPSYERTTLTRVIEEACWAAGVDVINLYEIFFRNEPETLYFVDRDSHWNDAGQALAAETVMPRVVEHLRDALRDSEL